MRFPISQEWFLRSHFINHPPKGGFINQHPTSHATTRPANRRWPYTKGEQTPTTTAAAAAPAATTATTTTTNPIQLKTKQELQRKKASWSRPNQAQGQTRGMRSRKETREHRQPKKRKPRQGRKGKRKRRKIRRPGAQNAIPTKSRSRRGP